MSPEMLWSITQLVVSILLTYGAAHLFCKAPDILQKLALLAIIGGGLLLVLYYAAELFGLQPHWIGRLFALSVEHIGVMLYIGRLIMVEKNLCKTSLPRSQPYPA